MNLGSRRIFLRGRDLAPFDPFTTRSTKRFGSVGLVDTDIADVVGIRFGAPMGDWLPSLPELLRTGHRDDDLRLEGPKRLGQSRYSQGQSRPCSVNGVP